MSFYPHVFAEVEGDLDFMRIFYNNQFAIYDSMVLSESNIDKTAEKMREVLFRHYGRIHVLCRLTTIISELCLIYDNQNAIEIKATDNISVKVMDYINVHYSQKLTVNSLQERYFISATTINTIVKKSTGKTFKGYLNFLRLTDAKKMIKTGMTPVEIYTLVGFSDYSAFYRAYKKYFGITPTEEKLGTSREQKWPFT